MTSLEHDVGIRAWANDATGFTGILKQRYSDFMVNEVDASGQVVHITQTTAKKTPVDAPATKPERWQLAANDNKPAAIDAKVSHPQSAVGTENGADGVLHHQQPVADRHTTSESSAALNGNAADEAVPAADPLSACAPRLDEFAVLCGSSNKDKLQAFLQAIFQYQHAVQSSTGAVQAAKPGDVMLDPILDKGQRTAVHNFFKQSSPLPALSTTTVSTAGTSATAEPLTVIKVCYSAKGQKRKREDGSRSAGGRDWPGGTKKYCKFALAKSNMDTQQCLGLLASMLHCRPGTFATAGTKDKRAVTVQHVTAFKITAERLAGLNPKLYNFQVGNFEYLDEELHLGQLQGNQFQITLREVTGASQEEIEAAASALKQSGFINYYGLQRFGSGSVPTHRVGAAMLRGQYEEAVRLIMQPHQGEKQDSAAARALYLDKGDVEGALAQLPRFLAAERAVLEGLKHHGKGNFLAALQRIPHGLKTMFVHSYQSYLWNAATSERCTRFGTGKVVEGDLVLDNAAVTERSNMSTPGTRGGERSSARLAAVHVVSADEADGGAYSIEDVVMPLPGSQVQYPSYSNPEASTESSIYHQIAAADAVSLEAPTADTKAFSLGGLSGDYRRIIHQPQHLQWQFVRYSAPDEPLALSELEGLAGTPLPCQQGEEDGKLLALKLTFQLPASSYATMLIRELTKMATGTAFHKTLTQKGAEDNITSATAAIAETGTEQQNPGQNANKE